MEAGKVGRGGICQILPSIICVNYPFFNYPLITHLGELEPGGEFESSFVPRISPLFVRISGAQIGAASLASI